MWGYSVLRCPACGASVGPDFVFCHVCGAALRPGYAPIYQGAYPVPPHMVFARSAPRPAPVVRGARARRGALVTLVALVVLWIPGLSIVGAFLLSIGSTLIFWDRRDFGTAHRSAVVWAYALFWCAAAVYAVVFLVFVAAAYDAWFNFLRMDALRPAAVLLVWDSTVPTELVVIAVALQVRGLLPSAVRRQSWWAGSVLATLVVVATVFAYLDIAAGLGSEFVRMASVVGLLNRISVARLVEGPGFAWLAYLYYRARANIVPKAAPADSAPATA